MNEDFTLEHQATRMPALFAPGAAAPPGRTVASRQTGMADYHGVPSYPRSRRWMVDTSMPSTSAARVLFPPQRVTIHHAVPPYRASRRATTR